VAQQRSPQDRMTHRERKKLESFQDRDDPYRPEWMGRTRFNTVERLRPTYPFGGSPLKPLGPDLSAFRARYAVVQARRQETLFIYDRGTARLAAIAEYRREGKTTSLRRWVRYHPSFTGFTVTDFSRGEHGEPRHERTRSFLRSIFHANSRGVMITGSGPFRAVATNDRAAWVRDGLLFHALKLLRITPGPTHDDRDRSTFGREPYKPQWAEAVPFRTLQRAGPALPFDTRRLRPSPTAETHDVVMVRERRTLLAYDRKSRLLSHLIEWAAPVDGSIRARCVAFHPSFSAYTVHDVAMNDAGRITHRISSRFERKGWESSPKNRTKVTGIGPFVRQWQLAAGRARFGDVLTGLLKAVADTERN